MTEIKHVLYATDQSQCALDAYEYAVSIASLHGAKLTLLNVIQEAPDLSIFDIDMGRSSSEKKWLEVRREYIQKTRDDYIDDIKSEYGKKCVGADEIIVETGIPSKMILLIAQEKNCDFIVMGVRGKGKTLNDALMGDTVRRVLHHASQPVLVVPPHEEAMNKSKESKSSLKRRKSDISSD
jgi:nucleotide-binding universal stress UspA family protein